MAVPELLGEHAFDKLRLLECTLGEFEVAIDQPEVIEEHQLDDTSLKELLLAVDWRRPLHVVVVADDAGGARGHGLRARSSSVAGLPLETLMRCERCDHGDRRPVRRAKLAERDGKVAVVLGVPMLECPTCAERWLDWDVARRLDELLTAMLAGDVELATRHFDAADIPAA